jgi:hypothetical protein
MDGGKLGEHTLGFMPIFRRTISIRLEIVESQSAAGSLEHAEIA